ncbi:MAG: monovalent cation/H(+) antiporter subunit G [Hyphomonadaceae bacterium]
MSIEAVLHLVGWALVLFGALLAFLGAIGVMRFPDIYTRLHAASITDTGGATVMLLGLALISGLTQETGKLAITWGLIMLTSPTAAHALANAAWSAGVQPVIGPYRIVKGKPDAGSPEADGKGDA